MKVLVTGSEGFIGKNLISHLQEIENIEANLIYQTLQIVSLGGSTSFGRH